MAELPDERLIGCHRCGLVQRVAGVPKGHVARCARCRDVVLHARDWRSNQLCAALSLAALILYPLGITLPVMELERLGLVRKASVWSGSFGLMQEGEIVIGLIVLVCSVVIPVLKLAGLFALTSRRRLLTQRNEAKVYRWIELAGRWGMIDVLLVAVTIAAVKLGDLVVVTPGPGVIAFGACVSLSLLASAAFHPYEIWEREEKSA